MFLQTKLSGVPTIRLPAVVPLRFHLITKDLCQLPIPEDLCQVLTLVSIWQRPLGQNVLLRGIYWQLCIVKTSLQTLLRRKATGEKGPATELEPGTYTLSRSFSHTNYWSQSQILCLPSPYVPVVGVPLYSDRLKPTPRGWYSVWWWWAQRVIACSVDPRACGGRC